MGIDADEIEVLAGLEAVRSRPALYVGDVAAPGALHQLVEAVLCAAFDEALGGTCQRIDVTVGDDGAVEVRDDGGGLPVEVHPTAGLPVCEVLLTHLLACRAMRRDPRAADRFCGGGIAVTNALSAWLEVEIERGGRRYVQRYERGVAQGPLADAGATSGHGTRLRFRPDPEIFGTARVDLARLDNTLDEIRRLAPRTAVVLRGPRPPA
ncbi:MAG: hypothetical protein H6709_13440 [Kofleriaceae bacterium]|nr:hypothetical protein [Kofleriaceae bacterium]MCB9573082.1 hypothetical protein [Kofleriaceae bacterium]